MVEYVHILFYLPIFRRIKKGVGGLLSNPPPHPDGTEKSMVRRGLNIYWYHSFYPAWPHKCGGRGEADL